MTSLFLRLILTISIGSVCFGQLPVVPFTRPAAGSSLLPVGMSFRLRASDLLVGANVSSWRDEIGGITFTNPNASTQPTNSASGVWFSGGEWLQSSNSRSYAYVSTQACLIVFKPLAISGDAGFGSIVGDPAAENMMGMLAIPNGFGVNVSGFASAYWCKPETTVGFFHDAISPGSTSGGGGFQASTNGVNAFLLGSQQGLTFSALGFNQSAHSDTYEGFVQEIIFWTNTSPFTALQVAGLHQYATNTYIYSP